MKKKEPKGIVIPVADTGALHNELRSRAGMRQVFEVRVDGEVVKMRGLRVYSRALPKPYGTFVLDWQTATKAKPSEKSKAFEDWQAKPGVRKRKPKKALEVGLDGKVLKPQPKAKPKKPKKAK